jgi:hypothetical protein
LTRRTDTAGNLCGKEFPRLVSQLGPDALDRPKVRAFRNWLRGEAGSSGVTRAPVSAGE